MGTLYGGILCDLADAAMGIAYASTLEDGESFTTLAPAREADKRPIYGAFFWLNGDGNLPVPKDAYLMNGAGGQTTLIIPSHDLVVVRLGHYKGAASEGQAFARLSHS